MGENSKKNRLNDLDGRTWERYSVSVWDIIKTPEETKLRHPATFPLELCKRLMEMYTKKGDTVLDPFMGSGSTMVAAKDLERKGVGLDINPFFVALAKRRLSQTKLLKTPTEPEIHCQDASNLLAVIKPESVDLVVTSPPYWFVHQRKRTADSKDSRPYSDLERDLGNTPEYHTFLWQLKDIFEKTHKTLRPGKRCVVIVMDIRVKSQFIPFHMDIATMMKEIGFILEDIIIWDRKREYSNLRPLGYPYVFVVNKIHEYIVIFRRENKK